MPTPGAVTSGLITRKRGSDDHSVRASESRHRRLEGLEGRAFRQSQRNGEIVPGATSIASSPSPGSPSRILSSDNSVIQTDGKGRDAVQHRDGGCRSTEVIMRIPAGLKGATVLAICANVPLPLTSAMRFCTSGGTALAAFCLSTNT